MTNYEYLVKTDKRFKNMTMSKIAMSYHLQKDRTIVKCSNKLCPNCEHNRSAGCLFHISEWLEEEHKEEKKMKFKTGDKVRVRECLIADKRYNGCRFAPEMEIYKGKEFVIEYATYYDGTPRYGLKGIIYYHFSDDMLEPAEFTKDDLQVNDIITIREGEMYMIHEFKNELFAIAYDEYNELKSYKDDFKEVDGLTDLDIVCVRRPEEPWHIERRCWEDAPIIYEEKKEPYDGKPFSELFEQQWNWLANNPEKNKGDWFKAFYPKEERPHSDCFACQSVIGNGMPDCEKCPICDWKGIGCLNGLYDAWWLARTKGELGVARGIAMAIANLKWEDKNGKE